MTEGRLICPLETLLTAYLLRDRFDFSGALTRIVASATFPWFRASDTEHAAAKSRS
jgi:hypothetical protein